MVCDCYENDATPWAESEHDDWRDPNQGHALECDGERHSAQAGGVSS